MYYNLKRLLGYEIKTTDDEIGSVKDFLFDDRSWAVRYLSIDTSKWLPLSRKVLLSPIAFQRFDDEQEQVVMNLSKEQVKNSPSIDEHKPISREYEELLFKYFGYGFYWMGPGIWGEYAQPNRLVDVVDPDLVEQPEEDDHNHLRSFEEVLGYHFRVQDKFVGEVSGLILNDTTWLIEYVLVESDEWLSEHHHYQIPIEHVTRIRWPDRQAISNLDFEHLAEFEVAKDA